MLFLKQYPEAGAWLQVQACLHNNLCVKAMMEETITSVPQTHVAVGGQRGAV